MLFVSADTKECRNTLSLDQPALCPCRCFDPRWIENLRKSQKTKACHFIKAGREPARQKKKKEKQWDSTCANVDDPSTELRTGFVSNDTTCAFIGSIYQYCANRHMKTGVCKNIYRMITTITHIPWLRSTAWVVW